jgi:hypothetical protein
MMTFDEAARLVRLQERLRNATYHEMRKDGHHKSSEGAVSLAFCLPPVVGDRADPYWAVEAYSYLLCPDGRTGTWTGKTAAEAIAKAEDAIEKWCFQSEMEQFGSMMSGPIPDDEFDPEGGAA